MGIIDNLRKFQINKSLTSYELAGLLTIDIDKLTTWYNGEVRPEETDKYRILKLIEGEEIEYNTDLND